MRTDAEIEAAAFQIQCELGTTITAARKAVVLAFAAAADAVEPDLTLGYIDRDGAEATDEALIFVGDDNEHTIHVKCPRAKAVSRDIVQAALRIRGLKAQLADSEARCLKAGNRIEELVTALTAAKAMADAVEVFLTMDDPDDMAADGVTVLCVHAKALEEKVAVFRAAGG